MTAKECLKIPMQENDASAKTVGEYFEKLLYTLWIEEDCFSGKRPFGNSGWKREIYTALVNAGVVSGVVDEDGFLEDYDDIEADRVCIVLIHEFFKGGAK